MLDWNSPWAQPREAALDTVSAEVHPGDRFEFWHEVAHRTVVDHNSRPKCSLDFQPELDGGRRTMIVAPAALTGHWDWG
jgi:hypothetical protein